MKMRVSTVAVQMSDGAEHLVPLSNRARVAWDFERAAKKWPPIAEAPFLYVNFVAWRELVYQELYAGDFKTFREVDCVDVEKVKDDDPEGDVDAVDPTKLAVQPGSPAG